MKTIILENFGGVDQLKFVEVPVPQPAAGEVQIQVKALSLNPVDVKTRAGGGMAGMFKDIRPIVLGWDVSGVVTAVGEGVSAFKAGDAVFGMVNFPGHGKAYAEYVVAPAAHLAHKPAEVSHEEAAGATLAALTALQVLRAGAVRAGQRILIQGASGGVGHYAVQMGRIMGAEVVGTSSAASHDFVRALGASQHVDYRTQRFEDVLQKVDFVLDTQADDVFTRSLEVIRPGGRIITIPKGITDDMRELAAGKGIEAGFVLVQSNGTDMAQIAEWMAAGRLKTHIAAVFSFNEMAQAHVRMEQGVAGKVIVRF